MRYAKGLILCALSVAFLIGFGGFHFSVNRWRERLGLFDPSTAGIWTKQSDDSYWVLFYLKPGKRRTPVDHNYECVLFQEGKEVKRVAPAPAPEDRDRYVCHFGKLFIGNYQVKVMEKGKESRPVKITRFDVPGPNLRVPAFWIQVAPMKPMPTRAFTVRVSALNNGVLPAKNVLVKIEVIQGDAEVGRPMAQEISELLPGQTATLSFEVPGLPVGRYEIRATIDPANDIDEIYENDNISSKEVWVSQRLLLR